jgi:hypothetical protein
MIDRTNSRFDVRPQRLAADSAYGSGGLAWLMQRGIEPHIPVLDHSAQTNGVFSRNDFTFDRDHTRSSAPAASRCGLLTRDNGMLIYRARTGARDECTLAAIAQNLRKLAKLIGFAQPPPLAAACVS